MKYKTARNLALVAALMAVSGIGYGVYGLATRPASLPLMATEPQNLPPPVQPVAEPVPALTPLPIPVAIPVAQPARPTRDQLRTEFDTWLAANPRPLEEMRRFDIFPNAPFQATIERFRDRPERFSNDPSQWSMIRIDFNRDGVNDEQWLLSNGRSYKVEQLGPDGSTVIGDPFRFFDRPAGS